MSSRYDATVEAWETVARERGARGADAFIHPDGGDPARYDASGKLAAADVLELVDRHLPRAARVLDFGCGNGRVLSHVSAELRGRDRDIVGLLENDRPVRAYGYDTSPTMREAARSRCLHAHILDALSVVDLDLVYSHAVFIHHTHDDGFAMLAHLARVVRPGGLLALQIPLYDVAREPETWTGVCVWTPTQLTAAADVLGLELVALYTNPGAFSYASPGPNHYRLQLLRRPA